jgi:hypothetical protein
MVAGTTKSSAPRGRVDGLGRSGGAGRPGVLWRLGIVGAPVAPGAFAVGRSGRRGMPPTGIVGMPGRPVDIAGMAGEGWERTAGALWRSASSPVSSRLRWTAGADRRARASAERCSGSAPRVATTPGGATASCTIGAPHGAVAASGCGEPSGDALGDVSSGDGTIGIAASAVPAHEFTGSAGAGEATPGPGLVKVVMDGGDELDPPSVLVARCTGAGAEASRRGSADGPAALTARATVTPLLRLLPLLGLGDGLVALGSGDEVGGTRGSEG